VSSLPLEAWRPGREDRIAWLIVLLPFLAALPQLIGYLQADPMLYLSELAVGQASRIQPGLPYADPNHGYGTQALGRLALWVWSQGEVPWWNHYTGIGVPLAAQYVSAAFFPITLLQLLPYGMAWQQLALQVIAGLGTYGLLRQLGTRPFAAAAGGLLFAFNSQLALFAHAPATVVPFLPWMLWGIDRIAVAANASRRGGWGMLAAAMALSLLGGFPETAYLQGLLALAWTIVRGLQLPRTAWRSYSLGIVAGGLTGIAIAAPQVYAFLEYLPNADIGEHGERFAHEALPIAALVPTAIPYFIGPIIGYIGPGQELLLLLWGGIGGYLTLALLLAAVAGFATRRDAISWLLLAWSILALLRTFGFPGLSYLWNLIPGISIAAFYRFMVPTWELAAIVLAARGLDTWIAQGGVPRHARLAGLAVVIAVALGAAYVFAMHLRVPINTSRSLAGWAIGSSAIAAITAIAAFALMWRARAVKALGAVLVAQAIVLYVIPTLSNPRTGQVDLGPVHFLRNNLGLQRFFTLGPLQPNYGAYFRVASVNYNVLPNSKKWVAWVKSHLDRDADSVAFSGTRTGPGGSAEALRRNLVAYEELGVRYVLAWRGQDPFGGRLPKVFSGVNSDIYLLANAKPYFDAAGKRCRLEASGRNAVIADCDAPDRVFRRELFHPGWTAASGGKELPIREHLDLYQSVELPAGRHEVRFSYAPPHIAWAWLASLVGLIALGIHWLRARR
jgi:hypothetical protein